MLTKLSRGVGLLCMIGGVCTMMITFQAKARADQEAIDCDTPFWTYKDCSDFESTCDTSTEDCSLVTTDYLKGVQCGCY
jgi:hypothetical protein